MQTSKERREALHEHLKLLAEIPEKGIRVSLETPKKTTQFSLTKTEQMYRH